MQKVTQSDGQKMQNNYKETHNEPRTSVLFAVILCPFNLSNGWRVFYMFVPRGLSHLHTVSIQDSPPTHTRTQCGDQQYGHAFISPLNKLVAFYRVTRHSEETVLALLLYWHLKKINCAQGGFQLVNNYYNSVSFMYN